MTRGPMEFMWAGFGIATVGFIALNYMSYRMRKLGIKRSSEDSFESQRWSVVKRHVGLWPIVTAAICIPAGIILTFCAIVYNNHMRPK